MTDRPISEDDLHAYVDGRLDDSRRAQISAYLQEHPEVADRFASYSTQRDTLRAALDPVADEPVPTRLNLNHMLDARRRSRASSWKHAVAAVALLFAGGSAGWVTRASLDQPTEGVVALAGEASQNYAAFAPDSIRPVEVRADHIVELVDWATARMGRKPVLPDLSRSGYRLMGGRVVPSPRGPGLMLMYDNDRGTRLVMLTRPMIVDQNRTMMRHMEGDVEGWAWATDGMGYSLVGAMPSDALHPLADDVRRQIGGEA